MSKQVRFMRALIPAKWTEGELSSLRKAVFEVNSQIKFIAFGKAADARGLVVLAQAQDKLTPMRWRHHLGQRIQDITPVEDLQQALESLRSQDGFEAYGAMSHSRRRFRRTIYGTVQQEDEGSNRAQDSGPDQDCGDEAITMAALADVYARAHKAAMERAEMLDTERRLRLPTVRKNVDIDKQLEGFGSDQGALSMQDILEADKQALLRAHQVFVRGLMDIERWKLSARHTV